MRGGVVGEGATAEAEHLITYCEPPAGRVPLSRERVLRGAVAVADASGSGALTMRSLASDLGVKPMSLCHYVAGKDEILDALSGSIPVGSSQPGLAVGRGAGPGTPAI